MRLVDFRFVERLVPEWAGIKGSLTTARILQVRHRELSVCNVDGTVRLEMPLPAEQYQWSEWEDVPLVEE